ncbi:tetraspanin-18-like [Clavelina lepadiformis]|uniref:tetraspanin-18-like n=1 Tax=Clavelina lepadiformis TaxID=159417 RepID=UPI0040410F2F
MRMEVKESLLKTLLYAFNVLLFVCGAVLLGLGIWIAIKREGLAALLNDLTYAGIYVITVSGALIMLFAFLGFYACADGSKPAIVLYCTLMLMVIGLKIAGCVIQFVFYREATDQLRSSYISGYDPGSNNRDTALWDATQEDGRCCGLVWHLDWKESDFYKNLTRFPSSCCVRDEDGEFLDEDSCIQGRDHIHTTGCRFVLEKSYFIIGAVAIVTILVELLAVAFMAWFYQHL